MVSIIVIKLGNYLSAAALAATFLWSLATPETDVMTKLWEISPSLAAIVAVAVFAFAHIKEKDRNHGEQMQAQRDDLIKSFSGNIELLDKQLTQQAKLYAETVSRLSTMLENMLVIAKGQETNERR